MKKENLAASVGLQGLPMNIFTKISPHSLSNSTKILMGLHTEHWLNAQLIKLRLADIPACRWCKAAYETVKHILVYCPTLSSN